MNGRFDEPKVGQALDALTGLARESVKAPSPVRLNHGLQALSARIEADKTRRRGWLGWSLVGAAAAAAVAYVLSATPPQSSLVSNPPLTYRIEGGSVGDGGYLRESGNAGMKLAFSEGSELVLLPGSRGRLRNVEAAGARVALEQGTASFQVTPRNQARWMVDVGPFLVRVTGTVFTVSWDAVSERFELKLQRGRVIVSGPISGGDIALRGGQRLVVNLPKAETLITEQPAQEPGADDSASSQPPPPTERPLPSTTTEKRAARRVAAPAPVSAMAKTDNEHRWNADLAAGRLDQIFADVARAGLRPTLETASSEDLFALAMAARYRRRIEMARQALLAERRRFAGSERALDAAFLLGRLAESGEGTARALEWYDEYLTRTPTGTYAAEALGRKMIVTSKLEGAAQAQPLAEEYLRRFPNGSYAGSARALRRAGP